MAVCKDSIVNLFLGKRLGKGAFRNVYPVRADDTLVCKVEYVGYEFANIIEWKVWNAVSGTPIEDWFAPCLAIDPLGQALIQERTVPFETDRAFKAAIEATRDGKLPAFFDDVHFGNFGMLEGRLVCHDYGFNHFLTEAVKFEWRNLDHEDAKKDGDRTNAPHKLEKDNQDELPL